MAFFFTLTKSSNTEIPEWNTQKIPFATNFNSKTNVHVGDDLNLYVRFSKSFIDECDFNVDLLYSDYPVSLKLIFFLECS